jgi:hypothetical protein
MARPSLGFGSVDEWNLNHEAETRNKKQSRSEIQEQKRRAKLLGYQPRIDYTHVAHSPRRVQERQHKYIQLRKRLEEFYKKHNPGKMGDVPILLDR